MYLTSPWRQLRLAYSSTVGQALLSLQQVRIEGECFYFFCFFTFIHFPLSLVSFSFIFSIISSISLSRRRHNDPQVLTCLYTPTQSISQISLCSLVGTYAIHSASGSRSSRLAPVSSDNIFFFLFNNPLK